MKKLFVAVLALTTATAFAGSGKHMVKLEGCDDGTCDALNFSMTDNGKDAPLDETETIFQAQKKLMEK